MIKSVREIEQDVVRIIKDSVLGDAVGGKVYLLDKVPSNIKPEYISVAHLTGNTNLNQSGVVIANIFINDVPYDGRMTEDGHRIKALCDLVQTMLWDYSGTYTLATDGNPETMQGENESRFINVRLAYSRMCV